MNEDVDVKNKDEIYSWDFYKDLQPKFLYNLYLKAERELKAFQKSKITSVKFKDFRYDEETQFAAQEVEDNLQLRFDQIKKTIDSHIMSIHGEN